MNSRIKQLQEEIGAKNKAAREILDLTATEKRALKAEENDKLISFEKERDALVLTLEAEYRSFAAAAKNPRADLSRSEHRAIASFDWNKILNHMDRAFRGQPTQLDGFEAEMVQEGEKEARSAQVKASGLVLPRVLVRSGDREARDMTATGTTSTTLDQGGMTIATNKAGLLDDFYNASIIRQAGATVLEGLIGNLDVPRLVADATAPVKKAENVAATENTPTTLMLSLTPKRLPSYIDISDQLLLQSSSAIEMVLRRNLTAAMVAVQEAAFFHGGGTSEANGIAGTSGIGSVAGGTNGAAPTWAHIVALETAVDTTNALLGNLHYATNGQVRGKLKSTAKVASSDSVMVLNNNNDLNGYMPLFTNAISRTLTKGSSGAVASAIFFGNFADYWVGYWSGISLELIRDKTLAIAGQRTLVASTYYDGGVVRPKSFAAMLDALAA